MIPQIKTILSFLGRSTSLVEDKNLGPNIILNSEMANDPAAVSLVDAIFQWKEWVYRRVDSVHPSEGARGRLKHSMDCIPPPDPSLAYDKQERVQKNIENVQGQLMVPLAFVEKGPMRHLDVWQNDGTTIPVLSSAETSELMVVALILFLKKNGVEQTPELEDAMRALVSSNCGGDLKKTKNLIENGVWGENKLWDSQDPALKFDEGTKNLLLDLTTDFLLIGLIPAAKSGTRQVLKFSYHWVVGDVPEKGLFRSLWGGILVAFRAVPMEIELPTHMPAATKSYHLEFHTPPELDVHELALPSITEAKENQIQFSMDTSGTPIAHVHAQFPEMVKENAKVKLAVPKRGIWVTSLLTSALTAGIFLLALLLPNAMETLRSVSGNAAALMLAAPAVFVGFLIFPKEHIFVSSMLNPLRVVVGVCALLLFIMAGSLVGELRQPFLLWLWIGGASFSLIVMTALIVGSLVSKRSERNRTRQSKLKSAVESVESRLSEHW